MHLEVNFPTGAITVMYSVSGKVFIRYQASAKQCPLHQGYLFKPNPLPKRPIGWEWARGWEGT